MFWGRSRWREKNLRYVIKEKRKQKKYNIIDQGQAIFSLKPKSQKLRLSLLTLKPNRKLARTCTTSRQILSTTPQ